MAKILILGGGFGGVVAAQSLANRLGNNHQITLVSRSIYLHKDLWVDEPASVRQGRFWHWAKRAQEKYWEAVHF